MYAMTGLYAESTGGNAGENSDLPLTHDTVIRCHSRNPSSGIMDHRWAYKNHLCNFINLKKNIFIENI